MNDYYSDFPQPPADIRARNLVDFVSREQKFRDHFTIDELKDLAMNVVTISSDYSMTGYNMFGFAKEKKLLCNVLESKMKSIGYKEDFN